MPSILLRKATIQRELFRKACRLRRVEDDRVRQRQHDRAFEAAQQRREALGRHAFCNSDYQAPTAVLRPGNLKERCHGVERLDYQILGQAAHIPGETHAREARRGGGLDHVHPSFSLRARHTAVVGRSRVRRDMPSRTRAAGTHHQQDRQDADAHPGLTFEH